MRYPQCLWFKRKIRAFRDIEIVRPLVETTCHFIASRKRIVWGNSFKDIRIILLTIGFPRSGSSLLGYLLTAHPNMVVADEALHPEQNIRLHSNLDKIFNQILERDYEVLLKAHIWLKLKKISFNTIRTEDRAGRYILIHNQYQGRFGQLKVIGEKHSEQNTRDLSTNTLKTLTKRLEKKTSHLKFIFTVRNPYDMYSTSKRYGSTINEFLRYCVQSEELAEKIDPQDIFYSKHEDMVANPRSQLAKICDFLQVPASSDYLDDCASVVNKETHKSRFERNWTKEEKQTIASLIEKYDFFSGYDWHT